MAAKLIHLHLHFIGVDAWINTPEDQTRLHRLIILAQNSIGYRNW